MKFYICKHCGNIIAKVNDAGVPVVCCGEKMSEIIPNTTEAATEKHIPVVKVEGGKVTIHVGAVDHPQTEAHHIAWILLETNKGNQRKVLSVTGAPEAVFYIGEDETVVAAYAYCNLHGLWMAK